MHYYRHLAVIFPSRSQLASKRITRTGRAEAVTKEGLAATLLPAHQPDQMGQRHPLRPVRPRSRPGRGERPAKQGCFACQGSRICHYVNRGNGVPAGEPLCRLSLRRTDEYYSTPKCTLARSGTAIPSRLATERTIVAHNLVASCPSLCSSVFSKWLPCRSPPASDRPWNRELRRL